ncbi:MAG: endonuclease domain-containing protein [Nitrososphaerota archaeon]|nr:endonuclease domain-containing protein [Nitrososphaerota archaeon]
MSYKNRMHPKVSKGEISVFSALSSAGLTAGMVTQQSIILKATIPDFCWFELKKAVYLDGAQVHKKDKQQQKDNEIVDLLEQKGWDVLRIPYEPPLTTIEIKEIVENIKQFIGSDEE